MSRSSFLAAAVVAALAAIPILAPATATAQPYPNRPVKIIVPTPPGGPVDVIARLLANALPAVLGQNVIVENRAGAGNTLGSKVAAAADPDGYTLLVSAASGLIMSPMVYKSAGYDENSGIRSSALRAGGDAGTVMRWKCTRSAIFGRSPTRSISPARPSSAMSRSRR